ncbi:Hypothetical Protein FCC1311_092862 [Hondaea fermentalgiana]|uniref:Phosphatidate phosphatase APP1 catalytic domain-containing protein n=1 Tax=Hondaea fermentalgiana TaxID=2315210 RepID=A0A2R5GQB7_9STRA|nr:Hypothetical Protein FCC1311_092862 [Hondaea fermentalgiana]|eukprot:GBG33062.1 Hypothetical Protein FCC1311_092862 [Hondaea fermentalgiana]
MEGFYRGSAALLVLVIFFVMTERFPWHRPSVEFVFWLAVLEASAVLSLLFDDSPLRFLVTVNRSPASLGITFGLLVPIYSGFLVRSFVNSKLTSYQEFRGGNDTLQRRLEHAREHLNRRNAHRGSEVARKVRRSKRADSSMFDAAVVDERDMIARSKLVYVDRVLDRLVFSNQIRMFTAWIRGQIEESQASIKTVVQEATPDELNRIMETVNVPRLLAHGTNGSDLNNLLAYIMNERSTELSPTSRAAVLHGLMRTESLPFIPQEMRWASDLFMGAQGTELTLLKNMLDSTGDFNNLYKLVFSDIADPKLRKRLLKHMRAEGAAVRKGNDGFAPIKLLSDVDDTLYCSGGSFPAGSDTRYPRHALYPGVLSLYEEIDRHGKQKVLSHLHRQTLTSEQSSEADSTGLDTVSVAVLTPWQKGGKVYELEFETRKSIANLQSLVQSQFFVAPAQQELVLSAAPRSARAFDDDALENDEDVEQSTRERAIEWDDGNIVFVSARPHVWKDVAENSSYRRFRQLVREGRMHAVPTMLTGSLYTGSLAVWLRLFEHMSNFVMDAFDAAFAGISGAMQDGWQRGKAVFTKSQKRRSKRRSILQEEVPEGVITDDVDEAGAIAAGTDVPPLQRSWSSGFGASAARRIGNHNWEAVGRTKVERVEQFVTLYPEYDMVFFGDNAQGDLLAAELLAQNAATGPVVQACFIHRVQSNDDEALLSTVAPKEREAFWAKNNILFYDTYVGAALLAYDEGLISHQGLHRVGLAVHDDLLDFFIRFPHRDWSLVFSQTKRDIRAANKALRGHHDGLQIPMPILPSAKFSS